MYYAICVKLRTNKGTLLKIISLSFLYAEDILEEVAKGKIKYLTLIKELQTNGWNLNDRKQTVFHPKRS